MMIPKDTRLDIWASSLVVDFPTDNIPQFVPLTDDEKEWKKWASLLVQENSFQNNGAPGPTVFKNAAEWSQAVFKSMASF